MMITDAEKLKKFRKSKKLSQAEFAKVLGVPQSAVSNAEIGRRRVGGTLQFALYKVYGLDWQTQQKDVLSSESFNIVPITIYKIAASAGAGTILDEEPDDSVIFFDKRFLKKIIKTENYDNLHVIYAKGDSMNSGWDQPDDIKDGDMLLVDVSQTTGNGCIFVIIVNNTELRVKRLSKRGDTLFIASNNPKYREEIYYPDDTDKEIKIVGKVVWSGGKENV